MSADCADFITNFLSADPWHTKELIASDRLKSFLSLLLLENETFPLFTTVLQWLSGALACQCDGVSNNECDSW